MSDVKHRLSATVDADLVAAAEAAVSAGQVDSVSAWVNQAMARQVERETRLAALTEIIAAHEAEYGEITDQDVVAARRTAAAAATVVRGRT